MGGLMNVDRTGDPGVLGIIAVGDAFCHTDPRLLRTACRLRSRTRRRWPTLRPKHLMEAQSWSATGLTPVPKLASGTRSSAPPTRRALCAGVASRWRSADATAAIRSSRSWVPWPLHPTTTGSSGAPSVASVYSTAPPYSTRTTPCMTESKPSSASLRCVHRRRQARPVRSGWLGWQRLRHPVESLSSPAAALSDGARGSLSHAERHPHRWSVDCADDLVGAAAGDPLPVAARALGVRMERHRTSSHRDVGGLLPSHSHTTLS